jgi:hypothetical protein
LSGTVMEKLFKSSTTETGAVGGMSFMDPLRR